MADEIHIDISETVEEIHVNVGGGEGYGGIFRYGIGVPNENVGTVGDSYLDTESKWLYQKSGLTTWTFQGALAIQVTNTHVQFVCPDGTTRRATLANIPA